MVFRTSAAHTRSGKKQNLKTKQRRASAARAGIKLGQAVLFDQLESRVLFSNAGYAPVTLASFPAAGSHSAQTPTGALVEDSKGDFFGTTQNGGANNDGSVFEIVAGTLGSVQTIASFNTTTTGSTPLDGLTIDSAGNLYGTTSEGGANDNGVVFEIPASNLNVITVLGSFSATTKTGGSTLVVDGSGDVFGTTAAGGNNGTGSVFEIPAGESNLTNVGGIGSSTTIASFNALSTLTTPNTNTAGAYPDDRSGLVLQNGMLYGTTDAGGANGFGGIFSVADTGGTLNDVADFTANVGSIGGPLLIDSSGSLFGTSTAGGTDNQGTIFEFPFGGSQINTLASFLGTNGSTPMGQLYQNSSGVLLGTASQDGGTGNQGAVFEMPTSGPNAFLISDLVTFPTGAIPESGLLADSHGDLFGTTSAGGANSTGSFFEATPVHLVISGVPTTTTESPSTFTPTVTLEGPTGNTVTTDDQQITLAINNGGMLNYTQVNSVNGVATFTSLKVTGMGTYMLTATDANGDISGTSMAFTVAPGPAVTSTQLAFRTQPVTNTGAIPPVTVAIEDSSGHIVTSDDSLVTISKVTSPGSLGGTLTVQAVDGIATFSNLSLAIAGSYNLVASDGSLTTATSHGFTVTAVPTSLSITSGPTAPLTAGVVSSTPVVVKVLDQFGNQIPSGSATVTLSIADGVGTIVSGGSAKEVNGIATFTKLKTDTAGTFMLLASSKGVQAGSKSITVVAAAAASMKFVIGPPDTSADAAFSISVELLDQFGNVATGDNTSSITLSLGGRTSAALNGVVTQTVTAGVANFSGLSITAAGTYQLVATDHALKKALTSAKFVVAQ